MPSLIRVLLVAAILGGGAGCRPSPVKPGPSARPPAASIVEVMASTYEDLKGHRFRVLADFETADQAALFEPEPPGSAAADISTDRARRETGVGSLKINLFDSTQRIVGRDSPTSDFVLLRDWSPYNLLLVSVYSPRRQAGFTLGVRSGTKLPLVHEHGGMMLEMGWNLLRIDLGELADHVDLSDVREVRFGVDPLDAPIDLFIDDLVLVDNSRDVFGSSQGEPGDLYVRALGRRLAVGAVGQFELVFCRGRIQQWFDLGQDPARAHNLAGTGPLGPIPVVLPAEAKAPVAVEGAGPWAKLGPAVQTYQSLVEANPLRATIEGEWRFSQPDAPADENSPYHRWVHTVCRDGRVYLECSGRARVPGMESAGIGLAFCCNRDLGFQRTVVEARPASGGAESSPPYLLFSRPTRGQADLLVVPSATSVPRALENPDDPRVCAVWKLPGGGDMFFFSAMVRVWPTDQESPAQAAAWSADYCRPLPIAVDTGRLVPTDPGDFDNDGFNESRGQYVLQLDENQLRVRIDGRRLLRFSPVFKLVDVANRDVWVYLDGQQVKEVYRDPQQNVIFAVPGMVTREVLIEVTSRTAASEPK